MAEGAEEQRTPHLVKAVECTNCGILHRVDSDTFVVFHGAVTIGMTGGILGTDEAVFCRTRNCLHGVIQEITNEPQAALR